MPLLPLNTGQIKYRRLEQAIQEFNATSDDYPIQKVYQLQVINYLLERAEPSPQLDEWLNDASESGWERQLQKIGVHRDASIFLKGIEFARAVHLLSPQTELPEVSQNKSFHDALADRDALLNNLTTIEAFETTSQYLFALSQTEANIQARIAEHQHFLALAYAKAEAIRSIIKQNFPEYETRDLSRVNNINFFLDIAGEPNPLVIRVEDRNNLEGEAELQAQQASEYFSEDYLTLMLPFQNKLGDTQYRPVVISQFASGGNLEHFAESYAYSSSDEKGKIAQDCFLQLSDFLIKLENSSYYCPDIKLSNFLYDKGRVFCADRKSLLDTEQAPIAKIQTTPQYAPPEFLENVHLSWDEGTIIPKKRSIKIDMPSFMSYQVGQAINEFLERSNAFNDRPLSNAIQNLITLQKELSRENPADRLTLMSFHQLLKHIEQTPDIFLTELEKHHPRQSLSFYARLEALEALIQQSDYNDDYLQKLQRFVEELPVGFSEDTRFADLQAMLENKLKNIETELHIQDKALATRSERMLDFLGVRRVPERSSDNTRQQILSSLKELLNPYRAKKVKVEKPRPVLSEPESKHSTASTENAEETFSGTFRRVPIKPDEEVEEEFSGTFRRVSIKPDEKAEEAFSGTFRRVPSSPDSNSDEETVLERYSPATTDPDTTRPNSPKAPITQEESIQKQKEFSKKLQELQPKLPDAPEAEDIDTSIHRGDKKGPSGSP